MAYSRRNFLKAAGSSAAAPTTGGVAGVGMGAAAAQARPPRADQPLAMPPARPEVTSDTSEPRSSARR
jgi:hypothetical protein